MLARPALTNGSAHTRPLARLFGLAAVALLLTAALPAPAAAAATAQEPAPALPPLGMHIDAAQTLIDAGAKPRYGSFWVGPWMATSGWTGLDNALAKSRSTDTTPVLFWYYWGDSISPSCIENGCDGRSKQQWAEMTTTLANSVRDQMGGQEVVIVLENEFNKGGVTDSWYAPTFDGYLEAIALELKAVPGVKIVVGFGAWGESAWERFPRTIAQSEYVGFQMMRASTRHTEEQYRDASDRIVYFTDFVSTKFNKPSFLYDLALSSYPDAHWEQLQKEELADVFDALALSGTTGLQGVLYRNLKNNPNMGLHNYFGYAERHWGLWYEYDLGPKPSWQVWLDKTNGVSSAPAEPAPANVPSAFEGESFTGKDNGMAFSDGAASGGSAWLLWSNGEMRQTLVSDAAQRVRVSLALRADLADGVGADVKVRLGGITHAAFMVDSTTWAIHSLELDLPAGSSTLAVAFTNDLNANGQDRNLRVDRMVVEAAHVNSPPVATLAHEGANLTWSFSGAGSSDPDGDALTYAWTMGDGTNATGANVTHAYAAAGTYVVGLTVSDGELSSSSNVTVTAERPNHAPNATFVHDATGLNVRLDANGSSDPDGDALTYGWDLGDGTQASGPTANHTYGAAGTYRVTLVVSDGELVSAMQQDLAVVDPNRAPIADFMIDGADMTYAFDASNSSDPDGDALSYVWNFSDGTNASGVRVERTFADEGEHVVRLTVSDGKLRGSADRTLQAARPNTAPNASFDVTGANLAWSFDASGSSDADGDALTYAWSFGDGSNATGANATHTYAAAGNYTVSLTVSDGQLDHTATRDVVAVRPNAGPTASFSVAGANLSWSFDASNSSDPDGDALSYRWTFGDGAAAAGANATHTYAAAGNYTVSLTVSDGQLNHTATRDVVAVRPNAAPVASFSVAGANLSWSFDASASTDADGDALTYAWSFGDGTNATGVKVEHSYATGDTHTVSLRVSDGNASSIATRDVVAVRPNAAPTAALRVSGANLSWSFDASASTDADGEALSYAWSFGDGTSGMGVHAAHTYAAAGTYGVTLTVTDGRGASSSATSQVDATMPPAPAAPGEPDGPVRVTLESEDSTARDNGMRIADATASNGAYWFLWSNGGIRHATDVAPGSYAVELTARGDYAQGWPTVELRADGEAVASWTIGSASWTTARANVSLPLGAREVSLVFTNDLYVDGKDRNVRLDVLSLTPAPREGARFEGEDAARKDNGAATSHSGASGGHVWLLWSNGGLHQDLQLAAGKYRLDVVATGDEGKGWPRMDLRVDGHSVSTRYVDPTKLATYSVEVEVVAGQHTLSVHFTNDSRSKGWDRNLRVDLVTLTPVG